MKETVVGIKEMMEQLRPFLQNDGGDIEFIKYEDFIVYVKIKGACVHCSHLSVTLKDMIEESLKEEFPEIKEVRNISSEEATQCREA